MHPALILCDVWDRHWCRAAEGRIGRLSTGVSRFVEFFREHDGAVIHAPSGTMEFYADHPARARATFLPEMPVPDHMDANCPLLPEREARLPIDDGDQGCGCDPRCHTGGPWRRQHPAIGIEEEDFISDSGSEIYRYLKQHEVETVYFAGVHANMCLLGRPFGIRRLTLAGFRTVLLSDLTDAAYSPQRAPRVSQEEGTRLVVEHIEKYWCPAVCSEEVMSQCQRTGRLPTFDQLSTDWSPVSVQEEVVSSTT